MKLTEKNIKSAGKHHVWYNRVDSKIETQIQYSVYDHVWHQVWHQVSIQIYNQGVFQVYSQIKKI